MGGSDAQPRYRTSPCTAVGRGSVPPIKAFTATKAEGRGLHLLARNVLSIQWENVFGNILSGRKTVFVNVLVMNSGHLQMNGKNGDYNAASEVLGQWVGAQHTDRACPAAQDTSIPLRKMQWRVMASVCGWSTASSLLFPTARWCGFFAFSFRQKYRLSWEHAGQWSCWVRKSSQ